MNKYIFLDTNIYDEASFSFDNPRMHALSKMINENKLFLLMCSVCKGEVKKHINNQLTECVQGLNRQLKERYWASLRYSSEYEDKLKKLDAEKVVDDVTSLFEDFLVVNNVVYFSVSDIDVEELISDHFNQVLPFEPEKPNEFKDAIMIRALINFQQTLNESVDIISKDEGFQKSFKDVPGFEIYASLDEWIKESQSEKIIQTLSSKFDNLVVENEIQDDVIDKIVDIECSFDDRIEYSFNSSAVNEIDLEINYAYITADDEILVMATARSIIDVQARYLDDEKSFYSREEKDYVFRRYIKSRELHEIDNDVLIKFSIISSDEDDEDDEVLFSYEGIESFDYDYIDLSDDTLIEILEEEEGGDNPDILVHCSQCGKVLGINENGCYFTSDYEPLCEDCCVTDEKGFLCPSCGLKHPYSDDAGDGTCRECFLENE